MSTPLSGCGLVVLTLMIFSVPSARAEKLPPLWGYGVKTCQAFLAAAEAQGDGGEASAVEYRRYEDWLTGLISGLNLATGQDVLVGADIDSAMRRIGAYCRGHTDQDFFTAAMDLVRTLSRL